MCHFFYVVFTRACSGKNSSGRCIRSMWNYAFPTAKISVKTCQDTFFLDNSRADTFNSLKGREEKRKSLFFFFRLIKLIHFQKIFFFSLQYFIFVIGTWQLHCFHYILGSRDVAIIDHGLHLDGQIKWTNLCCIALYSVR